MSDLDRVVIEPYDAAWPESFRHEAARIRVELAAWVLEIEHVGSTSVPGLAAKPIIDLQVGVRTLDDSDDIVDAMERLGYEYVPEHEADLPDRRFFRRRSDGGHRTHHVHLVERSDAAWWDAHLAFRDWLRAHPEDRERYERLKCDLADAHRDDRLAYGAAKTEFVEEIMRRAADR